MKAFSIDRYAKGSALSLVERPEPELRDNDVMIEIHAASVNPLDGKIRDGEFKLLLPYKFPLVLGCDLAGIVVRAGPKVRRFKPGDQVYARPAKDRIGTFAEYIAVDEADVALKRKNLTMAEAASVPLVALTAWQALVDIGQVKRGLKVFIQAGSSGVGTFAIQMAKHLGAEVATTASARNFGLVKDLGADVAIDYKTQDFETLLSGYDIVLNSQDAKTLEKSLRVLKPGGKLISISGPPDPQFAKDTGLGWWLEQVMRLLSLRVRRQARKLGVGYSFLFMKPSGKQLAQIATLIETGAIRPVVDKVFPFAETNEAMKYVDSGRARGKVVVAVR